MAKFNLSLPTILLIGLAVWLLAFGGIATVQSWFAAEAPAAPAGTGGIDVVGVTCPDDLSTTYDGDVVNSLDTSQITYLAQLGRFIPNNEFNRYVAFTAGTSAGGGTGVNLECGKSYKYYIINSQDGYANPMAPIDFGVVQGADASRVIQATNFSKLQTKVYDNELRANCYGDDLTAAGVMGALGETILSTTNTTWDIDVGESIDVDVTLKTVGTVAFFGNSDLGVYIAIGGTDFATQWDKPSVSIGGMSLVDVKNSGEISPEDLAVLNTYAYIFKVPGNVDFDSTPRIVKIYVPAKAGQDPDDDVAVRILAKGTYVDNDGYTIRQDIFNKNSGSEVLTATAQTLTFDVTAD